MLNENQKMKNNKTNKTKRTVKAENVRKKDPKESRLHLAVYYGNLLQAQQLINKGFDVNYQDDYGETALHVAVCEGHKELVKQLLNLKADINCSSRRNVCPIHIAANYEHREIFEILLDHDANVNVRNGDQLETPLHIATQNGNINYVKLLLSHKADINCINRRKETPLHLAVYFNFLEIVKLLLENNAKVNVQNSSGDTPLHMSNHFEITSLLLNYGADINIFNLKNETAVMNFLSRFKFNECHRIFACHIIKLQVIGCHTVESNELALKKIDELCKEKYAFKNLNIHKSFISYLESEKLKYIEEANKLRSIKISNYTNLCDIIFKKPNDLALLFKNEKLKQIWENSDILIQYPIYGYLLKKQLKMGFERSKLLTPAKESFIDITGISLPEPCSEGILNFFSNNELECFAKFKEVDASSSKCFRNQFNSTKYQFTFKK